MGDYTLLEFSGRVKPEYADAIPRFDEDALINVNEWYGGKFHEFSKVSRSNFIPFGNTTYFMNEYDDHIWTVRCALKNYDRTIESFIDMVASKVFEHVTYFFVTNESYKLNDAPREQYFFDGNGGVTKKSYYSVKNFMGEEVERGDAMDPLDARKYEMFSKCDEGY